MNVPSSLRRHPALLLLIWVWVAILAVAPALPALPAQTPAKATNAPAASAPTPQAPAAPRDPYRSGMSAAARGQFEEAAKLLQQVQPDHPEYARAMAVLGHQVYAQALRRPKDGVPYIERAYAAAPTDGEIVRAYLRTHILAGTWFNPRDLVRQRPGTIPPEFAFLASKPRFPDTSRKVSRARLEADLDLAEQIFANCFAYLEVKPIDYRTALDTIRASLDDETSVNAFEISMLKLISLFCDGHARTTRDKSRLLPKGYAPFVARSAGDRVVLIQPDGSGFLDPQRPFVAAIDGKPIADWLKVAGYLVNKESPQWHRRGALEMFTFLAYLRAELGLPLDAGIQLTLESEDGRSRAEQTLAIRDKPSRRPEFPRGDSRRIGDVGYLRLSQMTSSERVLAGIDDWMARFRDTQGLILDVRNNPGGTKSILHTLFPYFMKPGAPMRILEMTAYRLPRPLPKPNPAGFAGSSMSGQTVGSDHWKTEADRRIVADFIKTFRPDWPPPAGKFSEWHALGLDARANPKAYYYDKPVIVLQDSGTFSAGDIFVGAFEDHPNVTTMGTPTGGGNSLMESHTLPNSGVTLVLGWSAKYRPNGKLYDGLGIPPDIHLDATLSDLIGQTDTVLDAAVARLKAAPGSAPAAGTPSAKPTP